MDAQGDMNFHMNLVRSDLAVMVLGSTACGRGLHPGSLSHLCHKVWATVAQTVGFFPLYALPRSLSIKYSSIVPFLSTCLPSINKVS